MSKGDANSMSMAVLLPWTLFALLLLVVAAREGSRWLKQQRAFDELNDPVVERFDMDRPAVVDFDSFESGPYAVQCFRWNDETIVDDVRDRYLFVTVDERYVIQITHNPDHGLYDVSIHDGDRSLIGVHKAPSQSQFPTSLWVYPGNGPPPYDLYMDNDFDGVWDQRMRTEAGRSVLERLLPPAVGSEESSEGTPPEPAP